MSDADAVALHLDVVYPANGPDGRRHISVLLGTARLAAHRPFGERCRAELAKIQSLDLILVPSHPNAAAVSGLCRDAHLEPQQVAIPPGSLSSEIVEAVATPDGSSSRTTP